MIVFFAISILENHSFSLLESQSYNVKVLSKATLLLTHSRKKSQNVDFWLETRGQFNSKYFVSV